MSKKLSSFHREEVATCVEDSIGIMEDALNRCRRNLREYREGNRTPDELTTAVLHALAWGFANASAPLTNAIRNTSRAYEAEKVESRQAEVAT